MHTILCEALHVERSTTDEGYKVIEFNTFNSSGFYAHDIEKVVVAVTRHFAEAG
ncbi:ATP-grasp domain-containing protein [Lysobacter sp. BMK333-48F3]|uniref:ATP-grasp domain-containing protein n=1 Tax=Lysobacter sp. BMK333-48F3 TaxID=2867962 RepID=UPI001C8BFF17|nr:ATP-grasp domain-containing protein [Lysobacter sp. BMK333-48F3]MBX9402363.1 ATP-grasp domain-containing protein [Lysobacter sp. BMK333-48F3]